MPGAIAEDCKHAAGNHFGQGQLALNVHTRVGVAVQVGVELDLGKGIHLRRSHLSLVQTGEYVREVDHCIDLGGDDSQIQRHTEETARCRKDIHTGCMSIAAATACAVGGPAGRRLQRKNKHEVKYP